MKLLATCLLLFSVFYSLAQDADTDLRNTIDQFMSAGNPTTAIAILQDVEGYVDGSESSATE